MQLISYLQEAADLPLADLRAALKKDKRVSKIFTKNLQLDEIADVKEFVQTLRFYVLNNRHVLEFVKSRNGVSSRVNNWWLAATRKIRPETLTQEQLGELQEAITDLLRDITSTTNASYSNDTGQALWGWLNQMKGYRQGLSVSAIRELKSYPAIRPEQAIVVYRGMTFNENNMKEQEQYDGTMSVGAGLKFLREIRQGKRIADVDYDGATIWYRNKDRAMVAAYNGDEDWRKETTKLRGVLGFVISMHADPADIIVDTSMLPKVEHADPAVVIDAGKYTVRITNKITPEGEVDPLAAATDDSETGSILEGLQLFAHIFKPPLPNPDYEDLTRGGWDAERVETFKKLIQPESKAKILKTYQLLLDYYNEQLKNTARSELTDLASHPELGSAVQVAIAISDLMQERTAHPTEKDERYSAHLNRQKYYARHEMNAEDSWAGRKYSSIRGSMPILKMSAKTPRFRDWSNWSPIVSLMHMGGVPVVKDVHQKAGAVQHKAVLDTIDGFFKTIGEPKPADQIAAATRMEELISEAERNSSILTKIWHVRTLLDKLKD